MSKYIEMCDDYKNTNKSWILVVGNYALPEIVPDALSG